MRSLPSVFAHLFHPRRSNNHRPRVLHPEAYVFFLGIVLATTILIRHWSWVPGRWGDILGFASSITPAQVVDQTNQQRIGVGLPALTLNAALSQAALAKAQDMMTNQYWAHTSPSGTPPWTFIKQAGYQYSVAGENLARDFGDTGSMMGAWMVSATHRANIMNSRYSEIGIAVVDGNLQGYDTTLVVQMFGHPAGGTGQVSGQDTAQRPLIAAVPAPATQSGPVPQPPESEKNPPIVTTPTQPTSNPTLTQATAADASVLAAALVPFGELRWPPLFTPLQISKAVFLSLIMMIVVTLIYDSLIIGHRRAIRLVGKNLAHLIFLGAITFLVIFFKGGLVG